MTGTMTWTDEKTEAVKQNFAFGLSARQSAESINARFGTAVTRNAIIGKLDRLGLKRPPRPDGQGACKKSRKRKRGPKQRPLLLSIADSMTLRRHRWETEPQPLPTDELPSTAIPLDALTPTSCRWPYGDGPFLFCGAEVDPRHPSYCCGHMRLASRPNQTRMFSPSSLQYLAGLGRRVAA